MGRSSDLASRADAVRRLARRADPRGSSDSWGGGRHPALAALAARGYELFVPHGRLGRVIVKTDLALFRRVIRSRPPVLDRTLPPLSQAGDHSMLWIAFAFGLGTWGGRFGKRAAIRGLGSIALTSSLVSGAVKRAFRRPRPSLQDVPLARQLTRRPTTASFPSGHAASACAFAVGAASELPVLAPVLAGVAGAVAYSRIYTGVHYPVDVLVGASVGGTIALLTRVPWPLVPRSARRAGGRGEPRRLDASDDGSGLALVVNLDAGPAFRSAPLRRIRTRLPAARIVEREEGEDLAEILRDLIEECTMLGIAGGDGSVNAAAEVALAHGRPLLVMPSGTLNHLARDLALRSPDVALRAFTRGEAVAVDVATIDGRPFLNSASFGAYTDMVDHRKALEPRLGRWPAHLLGGLRAHLRRHPIVVTLDGRERRLWSVFIGNCHHEPPGFAPSWRPRLDDGVLDVRLAHGGPRWSRLRLVPDVLAGRLPKSAAYEQWDTRELRVQADGTSMRLARDGQTFDGSADFTVEKRPEKLIVYAPHA